MAQMNIPFGGAYGTSKSAMETLSHFLRAELQVYGIDVIIVGDFTTSALGDIASPIFACFFFPPRFVL